MNRFVESANFAKQANNETERLLALGFAALTESLSTSQTNSVPVHQLNEIKKALLSLNEGEGYVGQLDTAESVCKRRPINAA